MTANDIRNIALLGHGGSGKTSLAEQMLFMTKGTDRLGRTADGNTTCDYDAEEIKRQISISLAFAPVNYKGVKINVMDAPGNFDFSGEALSAIRAAECAVLVGAAKDGLSVGMERSWKMLGKKPRMIFINRTDEDNSDYQSCLDALKGKFGQAIAPIVATKADANKAVTVIVDLLHNTAYEVKGGKAAACAIPADMADEVEALRAELMEAAAGADEELMEKFFETMELSAEEIAKGLKLGVRDGSVAPVLCGSAISGLGVDMLMQTVLDLVPVATDMPAEAAQDDDGNAVEVAHDENGATAAIVFKTVADPFIGRLSYVKVVSGKVSSDAPLINMRTGAQERITKVLSVSGKKQSDVPYIGAGDIGAIPKLASTKTGDTLCSPLRKVVLDGIDYPSSSYTMAVYPAKKGDEDKVAQGIAKLADEDPTIKLVSNHETHEMLISGLGEQHLDVVISRLKTKYNVDAVLKKPKIAYRETIRKKVSAQGRYKKQSGGHGQFGDVWIEFEPCDSDGLVFAERVVGGAVPKNFFPAVEKGLQDSIKKGVLAGYPMVGIKATLYDGSYHPVDSSEMSFKTAASLAYKNGIPNASPTLLEPIGSLKANVPDANMGDVMGEVNKRRGRVLGMQPGENGTQIVEAEVPMAEMDDFATYIRQVTQGRGSFEFAFVRYEDTPANVAQKIIEKAKADSQE